MFPLFICHCLSGCCVRIREESDFYSDCFRVLHSGSTGSQHGVAVIPDMMSAGTVKCSKKETDRLLVVKLKVL